MKFRSAVDNGLATGAFQKCNWGQIDPMVYQLPMDRRHLFFLKPACPWPAKQLAVLSNLSPEEKYVQELFCLLRQNIC